MEAFIQSCEEEPGMATVDGDIVCCGFNPKAVSQLMGHAKEIITIDVYGDTAEIIEDCLDDLQPFIDEVIPKEESEGGTDFSEDNYIEQISEFFA